MYKNIYISGDNKKAHDKLTADGYKLTEGEKEYHSKHSENFLVRKVIGKAEVYYVDWNGTEKQFNKYMDDNQLRLHKQNGLRKESIQREKDIKKYNI